MSEEFILTTTPLPTGKMLIEASAGTGKTYSLIGIILRLVVEEGILLDQILVVTFTEAATAELKERVRSGLVSLLAALQSACAPPDPFERAVWERTRGNTEAIRRLVEALAVFDRSSISTIHGFCAGTLTENAFESGSLFDAEVLTNEDDLIRELANDFIRLVRLPVKDKIHLQAFALIASLSLAKVADSIREGLKPEKRAPDAVSGDCSFTVGDALEELLQAAALFKNEIQAEAGVLKRIFSEAGQLHGGKYRANRKESALTLIEELSRDDAIPIECILAYRRHNGGLDFFTQEKISAAETKSTSITLERAAFQRMTDVHDLSAKYHDAFEQWLLSWAMAAYEERKSKRNIITFDDMIVNLRDALEHSDLLVNSLRERYKVALIDEFQDTDSVQLAIFRKVFSTPDHRLYCVGDPKQSIYKFRGGDLETYLSVRREEDAFNRLSLTRNYRSSKAVIGAVNAVFTYRDIPHFGEEIPFIPARHPDGEPDETSPGAFVIRYLAETAYPSQIAGAVVQQTGHIKRHHETAAKDPFSFSKLAVLVNSHTQAREVANAFQRAGIPCIRKIDTSVFSTEEAVLLRIVLHGILECGRVRSLKAALATPLFGRTNPQLASLDSDDERLNREMDTLHTYRDLWQERGFMVAFQQMLTTERVRERLLCQPGGSESLSLYLHLAELLHATAQRTHPSPEGLVQHLSESIHEDRLSEDSRIRRSTDGDAVTISTIHSAKGLEYDYVIVPFAWQQGAQRNDSDENMRKLYVALTRARYRCVVMLTNGLRGSTFNNISAIASLLGCPKNEDIKPYARELCMRSSGFLDFQEGWPGPVAEDTGAGHTEEGLLGSPRVPPAVRPGRIITSFSALGEADSEGHSGADAKARSAEFDDDPALLHEDDVIETDVPVVSASGQDSDPMPRGTAIGRAVHAIFEHIDFTTTEGLADVVEHQLHREGFRDKEIVRYLAGRFPLWLDTPLLKTSGMRLNQIPLSKRINELEFHLPQRGIQPGQLAAAIDPEGWPELAEKVRRLSSLAGFIKGYVDLVFECEGRVYIADWKTNFLGESVSDYGAGNLRDSMVEALYPLQYLLYTVALDAHLRQRMPGYTYDAHFGGVLYAYLRGMGHGPGHSIFYSKPRIETLVGLRQLFGLEEAR